MSFIIRSSRSVMTARFVARPVQAAQPFTTSSIRVLKESDRHTEGQGEINEKHKQDLLQKQKEGKGHWKPELASDSEEAVAADRHEHSDHSHEGMKELQEKTKHKAEEKHKAGTSQDSGF